MRSLDSPRDLQPCICMSEISLFVSAQIRLRSSAPRRLVSAMMALCLAMAASHRGFVRSELAITVIRGSASCLRPGG